MGAVFRKPVSSSIDDLIEEGKRLHDLYLTPSYGTMEQQGRIYSQWITIRACIIAHKPSDEIRKWVNETHESFLHNSRILYRIPENTLEESLLN
jgi:hypothetical protein